VIRATAITITLSLSTFPVLPGQHSPSPAPGDRVRVTTVRYPHRLVGTVVARDADSLRIMVAGQPTAVAIPESSISEIEIRRWTHSFAGTGAKAGTLLGALGGAALGATVPQDPCRPSSAWFCFPPPNRLLAIAGGAALGSCVGAVLGTVVGSAIHRYTWEHVALDRVHVSLGLHGAGLALSLTFVSIGIAR
jgi:hypothetical protein